MRTTKTLIRQVGCPGGSESSLGAHAISLVLSWGGSNVNELFSFRLWSNVFCMSIKKIIINRDQDGVWFVCCAPFSFIQLAKWKKVVGEVATRTVLYSDRRCIEGIATFMDLSPGTNGFCFMMQETLLNISEPRQANLCLRAFRHDKF